MNQLKHYIGVVILVAVLTVATGLGLQSALQNGYILPPAASWQAVPIDWLFGLHFWAIAFLFSLIVGFLLYSVIVFRRKKGETGDGVHFEGNTTIEILWTLIPLATVIYFAYLGAQTLSDIQRVDPDAIRVNVTGRQWSWTFEYPELGIVSEELVLPNNKQALLRMKSQDVIHSFWVPEFRVKQDVLPGDMVRELRVTPKEVGEYKVRCAELCGRDHANMRAPVVVLEQADFDAWVEERLAADPTKSDDPVVRGQAWAIQFGCAACHSFDGTDGIGPSWAGLFGKEETMEDGSTVLVDAEYLIESIRDPGAQIVAGYQNVMPANIGEDLTDDQIADIIAFIESLK